MGASSGTFGTPLARAADPPALSADELELTASVDMKPVEDQGTCRTIGGIALAIEPLAHGSIATPLSLATCAPTTLGAVETCWLPVDISTLIAYDVFGECDESVSSIAMVELADGAPGATCSMIVEKAMGRVLLASALAGGVTSDTTDRTAIPSTATTGSPVSTCGGVASTADTAVTCTACT
eukprot:scaffold57768_cov25-Tisochrysis_lutea.AAC.2